MQKFYRINHHNTLQGLWYDYNGQFTGLIHDDFSFCANSELRMDFDENLVGYISAVPQDDLYRWFPVEDILKLQEHGYGIHVYESDDVKFCEKFQHTLINQATAKLVETHVMGTDGKVSVVVKI